MKEQLDYTVTLLETLKRQTLELLRETSRALFRIPNAKDMSRDELAQRICEKMLANPMHYLYGDIIHLPTDVMDVIFDMIDEGPQRLNPSGDDKAVAYMLSNLYFVDKRDWNGGKYAGTQTFALPEELVDALIDDMDVVEALRDVGDDLEMFANSAVILYGVVSLTELLEIEKRYRQKDCPGADGNVLDEKNLKLILLGRHDVESEWFLHGDLICHNEFFHRNGSEVDEVIEEFFEDRGDKPRWYPQSEAEFLNFCDESANLETPEAKALDKWLSKNGLRNFDKRTEALYGALYGIQHGERPAKVIEGLLDAASGKGVDAATQEFLDLYMGFANRMRLRVNNGHTAEEMFEIMNAKRRRPPILRMNPRAAVGRNDLCPCGSGKKFKKCCGMKAKDRAKVDALAQDRLSVYQPMRDITSRFVRRYVVPLNTLERHEVAAERTGLKKGDKLASNASIETLACIIGDYAGMMDDQLGDPPIKQLIKREGEFSGDDLTALEMFKKYRYTWLEVLEAERGVGVKCRDLLLDREVFLMECSLSRHLTITGMTLCAGIGELSNGTYMVLGTTHSANFENPKMVLKIVLSQLGIPAQPPIELSFADQARFAAETIRRINATGRFNQVEYGGMDEN